MEEWVGQWWHRAITRLADRAHPQQQVTLTEMQRSLQLLFHAGGGGVGVRVTAAAASQHAGPRRWLERVAGSGQRAAQPRLDPETLALPPRIAVFPERTLNRNLYLWLAALASVFASGSDWISDNRAATRRALQRFPGLREPYQRLLHAHLAQRPALSGLRGAALQHETAIQAALRGEGHAPLQLQAQQVAPVWLWLIGATNGAVGPARNSQNPDGSNRSDTPEPKSSAKRRQAQQVQAPDERNPMLLSSKLESIRTWSARIRHNRASDDEDDPDALAAADDMDTLSLVQGDKTTASRIRFDLDLPSAAVDDLPLGPGTKTPEWDWRLGKLLPEHCLLQCVVARPGAAYQPSAALQATARRMRRRMEVLRAAPRWQNAQAVGEELDLDAWVRFRSETKTGVPQPDTPPIYRHRYKGERSLATLLLADLSLSTDAYATSDARVIDVIQEALYVFGCALSGTDDAFEMLGFSSVRRSHVRLQHIKGFGEGWSDAVRARIGALKPGYYTRMGAAIRDATRRLGLRPERQRLLLVLTDGKPNDIDIYEGRYGLEDTRHAVQEARAAGLTPFAVTIDRDANSYMPLLFGSQGFALVRKPAELVARLTQVWTTLARAPN